MLAVGRTRRYSMPESTLNWPIAGVTVLPITPRIPTWAAQFPRDYSGNPADRIIGGTVRAEGPTLGRARWQDPAQPAAQNGWLAVDERNIVLFGR
jgi:hypothetical protein